MGKPGDRAGLAVKALRVGPGAEELDGHAPVELGVERYPDLGHATDTDPLLEAIAAADHLLHSASSL